LISNGENEVELKKDAAPHSHLEIHALIDGGYVVREGRFDGGERWENANEARWCWRQERAAFSSLSDAIKWMGRQMVDKDSTAK
jgi:hypothetical protein